MALDRTPESETQREGQPASGADVSAAAAGRERGAGVLEGAAQPRGPSASDDLLMEIQRIAGLGGFVWSPGAVLPVWTDEFFRILGYEPGSVTPGLQPFFDVIHPADRKRVEAAWATAQSGAMPDIEYRIVDHTTGDTRFVRGSGKVYLEGGRVLRIVGALQDITQAKRSAVALEEALAIARAAENVAQMGSFVLRTETREVVWTEGLETLTGLTAPAGDCPEHLERVHPDDREKHQRWWQRLLREHELEPLSVRMLRPDGSVRHLYTQARLMHLADGGERVVGTTMDVTERVALEEQLRHAAKMEAIGTLAAGVAHDFNNYLMVMDSSLIMLADSSDAERGELVDSGRLALSRCMELTRQLLAFARRQPFSPQGVDLSEVVGNFQDLLHRAVGRRATLSLEAASARLRARVDPHHIERMLANLVVNAVDAIEEAGVESGHISVRLSAVDLGSSSRLVPADIPPGCYVCVAVEDNGGGIDPERLPRIFDPYFTTKAHGRGTGLGLASVYGMVRQNDGHVSVAALKGGTRFTLWFPRIRTDVPAEPRSRLPLPSTDAGARQGAILVVDDVDQVREIAARILRSAGFRTLTAQHGSDALAVLDVGHDVRLILTDIQMPVMGGRELAERLRSRSQAPPVVFMTGYSERTHGEPAEPDILLLAKPFTPERLVDFVKRALVKHGEVT